MIDNYGQYALVVIPLLAFVEACVGVGLFVSGVFLVIVASLAVANGIASIQLIMILAFVGATLGDHVGFFAGRWIGPRFHHLEIAKKYKDIIFRTEALIKKFGWLAIFFGRVIPAIRSLVPALVGLSDLRPLHYSILDVLACLTWASALGLLLLGVESVT